MLPCRPAGWSFVRNLYFNLRQQRHALFRLAPLCWHTSVPPEWILSHSRWYKKRSYLICRSVGDLGPGAIGVVFGHGGGQVRGCVSQIFLVDDAVLIDEEGHDATDFVLSGIGDQSDASGEVSVCQVAFRSTFSRRSLRF